jgi:hypothetical protein
MRLDAHSGVMPRAGMREMARYGRWIDSAQLLCYNPQRVKTRTMHKEESDG